MRNSSSVLALSALVLGLFSCSSAPVAKAPGVSNDKPAPAVLPALPPASAPPRAAEPAKPEPEFSPGFVEALAALRPAGTQSALEALVGAPSEPEGYAQAALAYAPTDAAGMTLLWGMTYQAMGGGSADAAVAGAVAKVLSERILANPDQQNRVTFNLRLAPGPMPLRKDPDGSVHAPIAHAFESLLSAAVTNFRPPWTIAKFNDALSTWAGLVATHGTALDEQVELVDWLVTRARAGQLEAFCHQLLGPAFPAEHKTYRTRNAAALEAYRDFSKTGPLRPTRAVLPDTLVQVQ